MKRSSLCEVLDRRRDMLVLNRLGVQPKDFIPKISAEHGVSEDAVKKDWSKRKEWMKIILKIDDLEALAIDTFNHYEVTVLDAFKLFEEAKDTKTKIQTIWLRLKALDMRDRFLRNMGAYDYLITDWRSKTHKHDNEHLIDFI